MSLDSSRITRFLTLATFLIVAGTAVAQSTVQPDKVLKRGVTFLMSQQAEDGGWHSETYGSMREGASLTAIVLYALSRVPEEMSQPLRDELVAGYRFLEPGLQKNGFVTSPDGTADFPTYASALTLTASRRLNLPMADPQKEQLIDYLVASQLGPARGFGPNSPHFGGWELIGDQVVAGRTTGTNISLGRFVLEALAPVHERRDVRQTIHRARNWLRGCQNLESDGGFFFTPDPRFQSNKARLLDNPAAQTLQPRSYGTTTCDGLHCLLHCKTDPGDRRVVAATGWLVRRPDVTKVPGFEQLSPPTGWEHGLKYYYYASLAGILRLLPDDEADKRRAAVIKILADSQARRGSWRNENARMREDDPLIATSFSVIALSELMSR